MSTDGFFHPSSKAWMHSANSIKISPNYIGVDEDHQAAVGEIISPILKFFNSKAKVPRQEDFQKTWTRFHDKSKDTFAPPYTLVWRQSSFQSYSSAAYKSTHQHLLYFPSGSQIATLTPFQNSWAKYLAHEATDRLGWCGSAATGVTDEEGHKHPGWLAYQIFQRVIRGFADIRRPLDPAVSVSLGEIVLFHAETIRKNVKFAEPDLGLPSVYAPSVTMSAKSDPRFPAYMAWHSSGSDKGKQSEAAKKAGNTRKRADFSDDHTTSPETAKTMPVTKKAKGNAKGGNPNPKPKGATTPTWSGAQRLLKQLAKTAEIATPNSGADKYITLADDGVRAVEANRVLHHAAVRLILWLHAGRLAN